MDSTTEKLNSPLVSILMLTHNRATYIGQAISSILSQTYQNWELYIIDDGSTDNTSDIIQNFTDSRINYIKHLDNQKLLIRRQESLTYANGQYTAVLDSDDLWNNPDKLAKQVAWLEEHPDCAVIGSFVNLIDGIDKVIGQVSHHSDDTNIRKNILWKNQFTHSSVLLRSSILKATNGYLFPLAEDLDLFLEMGKLGTLANLPEVLTSYRIHPGGISKVRKMQMIDTVIRIITKHRQNYPSFVRGYLKYQLYRFCLRLYLVG